MPLALNNVYKLSRTIPAMRKYHFRSGRHKNNLIYKIAAAVLAFALIFGIYYVIFMGKEGAPIPKPINTTNATGGNETENKTTGCDDSCLIDLAIVNADSSYCLNMSDERSDECWQIFSNADLSACIMLKNYTLKKACVNDFALIGNDAAICEALEGADRTECAEKINPPCMNISDLAEQGLCLARRYGDVKYCGANTQCILSYATERGDVEACGQLGSDAESYACRSVVGNTNECSLLSGLYTLDYCYQLLAQYSNDFAYCDYVSTGAYKSNCYLSAAIAKDDKTYCEKNDLEYIWKCYSNYSVETGDIQGCFEIDKYASGTKDSCLNDYAKKYSDPSACNNLSTIYIRTNCYAEVILAATNLSVAKCDAVSQPSWRDKCFTYLAKNSGDISVCNYVVDDSERSRCDDAVSGS